ncbi:E3 ubiquitin- ligase UPL2-like [Paramuricea clavata]|uniref:E3 ubiquitin- ligase UPL2-like n=1 Tax=Paramuricea clavata TaxID=317549 RepID=A0A6S7HNU1_PARCT|nr:E3 ubiquitin- ligase UPL2-like [Paramuricea clavata]
MVIGMCKLKDHQKSHTSESPPRQKRKRHDLVNPFLSDSETENDREGDENLKTDNSESDTKNDVENILNDVCPDASTSEIKVALQECNEDVNAAAQQLLGIPLIVIGDGENRPESSASSNIDTCNPIFLSDLTPEAAVLEFQKQKIDEDLPKQRFTVCRVDDIVDIDLRQMIVHHLNVTSTKESQTLVTASEKEELLQYFLEAGIDPDTFPTNRELVIQELMMFHVIDKRRLQLNDIAKGMDEVSLTTFLIKCSSLSKLVFPEENERIIKAKEVINCLLFQEREESEANQLAADFFLRYIEEIEKKQEDGAGLVDLIHFWTACNCLQHKARSLLVKFDGNNIVLPLSETCFKTIVLPTKHSSFESFKNSMDMALKFGAHGFVFN